MPEREPVHGAMAVLDRQVGHGKKDLWEIQLQPDLERESVAIGTRILIGAQFVQCTLDGTAFKDWKLKLVQDTCFWP